MNTQIKKLEFTSWLYFLLSNLEDILNDLHEKEIVDYLDFPYISVFYLNEMFWGNEVAFYLKECTTQEEYDAVVKKLSEKEIVSLLNSLLKSKGLNQEYIDSTIKDLDINFFFYY